MRANLCQDPEESESCCGQWHVTWRLLGIWLPRAWLFNHACPMHVGHVLTREKAQHFCKQEKTELQATRLVCFLLSCSTWSPVFKAQQGILQIAFSSFILLSWFGVRHILQRRTKGTCLSRNIFIQLEWVFRIRDRKDKRFSYLLCSQ